MASGVAKHSLADDTNQGLANQLFEVQKKLDHVSTQGVAVPTRTGFSSFPAQYTALKDPPLVEKQRVYNKIKQTYAGHVSDVAPTVTIPFDKADIDAWKEKEKMSLQLQFDAWISQKYDPFNDPAEAEWLQKMYPEYFEARIKENETLHDLQKQWAKILIGGPKSKEDLYLKWRVEGDSSLRQRLSESPGAVQPDPRGYMPGAMNKGKWGWRMHRLERSMPENAGFVNRARIPRNEFRLSTYDHGNRDNAAVTEPQQAIKNEWTRWQN